MPDYGTDPELLDLDQFLEDEQASAPPIRLHGETVRVQPEPPFDLLVKLYRAGKDDDVAPEMVLEVVRAAVGVEVFERWRERGIGPRVARKIMGKAIDFWGLAADQEEEQEGEAPAPTEQTGSGPSSSTGHSSSPISNGSTGSTSSRSGGGSAGDGSGGSSPASPPTPGSPWPSPATTSG